MLVALLAVAKLVIYRSFGMHSTAVQMYGVTKCAYVLSTVSSDALSKMHPCCTWLLHMAVAHGCCTWLLHMADVAIRYKQLRVAGTVPTISVTLKLQLFTLKATANAANILSDDKVDSSCI